MTPLVKGRPNPPPPQRGILLIQLGDIGDVVLTMPTIRALAEAFPGCPVHVAVRDKAGGLIDDCPLVGETVAVAKTARPPLAQLQYQRRFFSRLSRLRCDWAVELRTGTRGAILALMSGAPVRIGRYTGDGRLWRNRIFSHLVQPAGEPEMYAARHNLNIVAPFGIEAAEVRPRLEVTGRRKQAAARLMPPEASGRPIVAVHPFSLWPFKEWREREFVRLVDHLQDRHRATVVLTGSPGERLRAESLAARCRRRPLNLAGKTRIEEMPALMSRCRLLIGVDTAALHIAAAVGTPTVGIFGPSPASVWATPDPLHGAVSKAMHCVPCRRKGCDDAGVSRCLDELRFEEIREAVDRQISETAAGR